MSESTGGIISECPGGFIGIGNKLDEGRDRQAERKLQESHLDP
jgi:hypothetical protein